MINDIARTRRLKPFLIDAVPPVVEALLGVIGLSNLKHEAGSPNAGTGVGNALHRLPVSQLPLHEKFCGIPGTMRMALLSVHS